MPVGLFTKYLVGQLKSVMLKPSSQSHKPEVLGGSVVVVVVVLIANFGNWQQTSLSPGHFETDASN